MMNPPHDACKLNLDSTRTVDIYATGAVAFTRWTNDERTAGVNVYLHPDEFEAIAALWLAMNGHGRWHMSGSVNIR